MNRSVANSDPQSLRSRRDSIEHKIPLNVRLVLDNEDRPGTALTQGCAACVSMDTACSVSKLQFWRERVLKAAVHKTRSWYAHMVRASAPQTPKRGPLNAFLTQFAEVIREESLVDAITWAHSSEQESSDARLRLGRMARLSAALSREAGKLVRTIGASSLGAFAKSLEREL